MAAIAIMNLIKSVNNLRALFDCNLKHNRNRKISSKIRNFEYPRFGVDVVQKLQILMQKTQ